MTTLLIIWLVCGVVTSVYFIVSEYNEVGYITPIQIIGVILVCLLTGLLLPIAKIISQVHWDRKLLTKKETKHDNNG